MNIVGFVHNSVLIYLISSCFWHWQYCYLHTYFRNKQYITIFWSHNLHSRIPYFHTRIYNTILQK